ncbi:MAG TPA: flagellar basal body L-ring protein FlgH [Stellaceae bacterium]|nr:flagellar basal body L-ring protein FlgH [Stellaceae bacterium]
MTSRLRLVAILAAGSLAGCSAATRVSQIGEMPPLTTIQDPHQQPGYKPVSLPMPTPMVGERRPNSLWQAGSRAFFKDQRAANVGDILTVVINFDEKAIFDDETQRQRTSSENEQLNNLFGLQAKLPNSIGSNPVNVAGASNHDGKATMDREEQVNLQVAALVMQVLPNGNLVVQGHQEFRVNYEVRELQLIGVIRPQDISSTNTVDYSKLAEARISYGGRGQLMDIQQPRYGQQFLDILQPF